MTRLILALTACLLLLPAQIDAAQTTQENAVFQDLFKGRMTDLPGGQHRLYPDKNNWAFTFWPGSVWPESYGDGTNWLDNNGESQAYLSPFIGAVKGRRIPERLRYDPFSIQPDGLHIRAALLTPEQQQAYQIGGHRRFGSGILRSRQSFLYGQFRLVAKIPSARGAWSAFWLLAKARYWPPEIDIFEAMPWAGHEQQIHVGIIPREGEPKGQGGWIDLGVDPSQDFHEYGMNWTKESITFLFDGRELITQPTPPSMQQPMYVLINLAVGGKWPYNELGIRPIDSKDPERLARGADAIQSDYPADMIIRSFTVTKP